LPATWRPDPYQDWTFTSKQTMIYQDTPRFVGCIIHADSISIKIRHKEWFCFLLRQSRVKDFAQWLY
jgi:hypothetical protein